MLLPCLTCDILFDGHLATREILQKALYKWLHQKSAPLSLNIRNRKNKNKPVKANIMKKNETRTPVANKSPWQHKQTPRNKHARFTLPTRKHLKLPQVFQQIHVKDSLRKTSKKRYPGKSIGVPSLSQGPEATSFCWCFFSQGCETTMALWSCLGSGYSSN